MLEAATRAQALVHRHSCTGTRAQALVHRSEVARSPQGVPSCSTSAAGPRLRSGPGFHGQGVPGFRYEADSPAPRGAPGAGAPELLPRRSASS